ncbi:MAG: hypothetical protein FD180_1814 [Planctomycetota bacterium]|nr:MAG: hypothetical protein FD180_1814 [Planctomycetota bacterium]
MTRDFRAEAEAFANYLLADDSKGSRRRVGDKVIGRCPLPDHEDKSPSFGFDVAKDASACSCSEATGKGSALRALLGWKPDGGNGSSAPGVAAPVKSPGSCYGSLDAAALALSKRIEGPEAGRWIYQRADASELFAVLRFNVTKTGDDGSPFSTKEYRPVRRDVDGWRVGDPPAPLPLYRLPLLGKSRLVAYVEGEKCADALAALGFTVTTNAHGAKAADKSDFAPLAGRDVRILPDNDKPGEALALDVAARLSKLTPPARARIVRLPGIAGLGEGADVVDWISWRRGTGSSDEGIIGELSALFASGGEPAKTPPRTESEPVLIRADSIEAKPLAWTWKGWIPSGKLVCWIGDPSLGKSLMTLDIAARVTTGAKWPDGSGPAEIGSVVVMSAEDDAADTLKPRLMAAGADLSRVHFLTMVRKPDGRQSSFTLADLGPLEKAIKSLGDVRLIIIDPVTCFLGGKDSYVNAQVRELLAPLAELAARFGVAVVFVTHRPKGGTTKAVYSASGSLAFTAAARAAALIAEDSDDRDRRFLLPVKSNLALMPQSLAYRVGVKVLDKLGEIPFIAWEPDPVDVTAEDIISAEAKSAKGETREVKREKADDFLRDILAPGRVHSVEVMAKGEAAGFRDGAIRSALRRIGGIVRRNGFGGQVFWELGTPDPAPPDPHTSHTSRTSDSRESGKNGKYGGNEAAGDREEGGVL